MDYGLRAMRYMAKRSSFFDLFDRPSFSRSSDCAPTLRAEHAGLV